MKTFEIEKGLGLRR